MKSWKTKSLAAALILASLSAGVAWALPANGFEITYYDAQGNVVGEKSYYCGSRIYSWGQTTSIYDRFDFTCN